MLILALPEATEALGIIGAWASQGDLIGFAGSFVVSVLTFLTLK